MKTGERSWTKMHDGGTDKIVRFFQNFYLQRFGDYFACHQGMSKDLENAIGPRLAVLKESPMSIPNVKSQSSTYLSFLASWFLVLRIKNIFDFCQGIKPE